MKQAFIHRGGSIRRSLLFLSFAALAGCSGGDDDDSGPSYEITDQPLQGQIDGVAGQFVEGHTSFFLSEGEDDFFTSMYSESFIECTPFEEPDGSNSLIVSVPKETGDYTMGNLLNMTFVYANGMENLVATTGRIVVEDVTATSATGRMYAIADGDADFEVDGEFTITICPE